MALPIRSRVGQVEALVDDWKIRNDIAFYSFHNGRPVVDGWIFHFAPFQAIADQFHHGSLQELIQHHLASVDSTFHDEGTALQAMVDSAEQLRQALQALNTDLFHQLVYLLAKADPLIARATWEIFSPSFNLTAESVVFALIVGVAIWLVFLAVWILFARLGRVLLAK